MFSRSIRLLSQITKRKTLNHNLQTKRNSGHYENWVYRTEEKRPEQWRYYAADSMNAFMWWWIFVHVWYQWGHIVGEFDYPEPELWTDEELGVVSEE